MSKKKIVTKIKREQSGKVGGTVIWEGTKYEILEVFKSASGKIVYELINPDEVCIVSEKRVILTEKR